MNFSKKLIYLCATVLTAVLSVGCSQSNDKDDPDDPGFEEGVPTEVRITLSACPNNATRADGGTPKDPTSSVELIHDWWLVFIDKNINVTVITRDDVSDKTSSSSLSDPTGGFEAETFKTILPSGTYRIYAFANIPYDKEKFEAILKDKNTFDSKNGQIKNTYINDLIPDAFTQNNNRDNDAMQWRDTENIPMTQVLKDLVIKNTVEEIFNIEVIRAVAKVEFAFSNPSTEEITLETLLISPISNDRQISIVPNNDAVGIKANEKLITDGVTTGTLSFDLGSTKLTSANPNYTLSFYCKESLPHDQVKYKTNKTQYDNDKSRLKELYPRPFQIDLTVDKNGTTQNRTFYTTKITYINRNDWIHIPIKFNNWAVKWKLHTYPPIGGYPPVFGQAEDGSTLTAKMTTGGEFELYPVEFTMNGNSYKVDMNNTQMADPEVTSDPKGIFLTAPKLMDNPNVSGHPLYGTDFPKIIAGELDPKKEGTATVEINFYLEESAGISEALTCTFTITRTNGNP